MTQLRAISFLILITAASSGLGARAHADDAALDGAYGTLSGSYNRFFETLMNSPDKSRSATANLSSEILAPAQSGMVHAMYDNSSDSFSKAGIGSSNSALSAKDLKAAKSLPEVTEIKPMKGFENIGLGSGGPSLKDAEMEAVNNQEMAGPYAPGFKPSADAVVVDGSQFARELTFPGKPKTPAAASNRAPASVPISR